MRWWGGCVKNRVIEGEAQMNAKTGSLMRVFSGRSASEQRSAMCKDKHGFKLSTRFGQWTEMCACSMKRMN